MSHTVSGTEWRSVRFNGREVGETGINAALCGTWSCPVLLVTGDQVACREATELLGAGLETVQVKTALGRFSARHKTPGVARTLIEAGARRALADLKAVAPWDPGRPCEVRVELGTPDHTEQFRTTRRSRSSTRAPSSAAARTGGRPGASSTSPTSGRAASRCRPTTRPSST